MFYRYTYSIKSIFSVKSQSDDSKWFDVVKEYGHNLGGRQEGQWTCNYPDFIFRAIVCKHIYALSFLKQANKKIVSQDVIAQPLPILSSELDKCSQCHSENSIIKYGIRHNKGGDIQRYRCKVCNHKFIINHGFERCRVNPKAVTAALDQYFKGISLRKACDHLKQFYDTQVSHVAIIKWLHDGLPSYNEAFQKEYFTLKDPRVKNIRSISVRNQGLNSTVERLHGTIRDREKVMGGMQKQHKKS